MFVSVFVCVWWLTRSPLALDLPTWVCACACVYVISLSFGCSGPPIQTMAGNASKLNARPGKAMSIDPALVQEIAELVEKRYVCGVMQCSAGCVCVPVVLPFA